MDNIGSVFDLKEDYVLGTIVVMDSNEAQINEGKIFEANIYKTAMSNGSTYSIYFTSHTTKYMHLKNVDLWSHNVSCKVWASLYEGITATTTGGASVIAYNKNRNASALTSTIVMKKSATVTVGGATLLGRAISNGNYKDGTVIIGDKWILKANTKYGVIVKNTTATTATTDVNVRMQFSLETEDIG